MPYEHGVYATEQETSPAVPTRATAGLQVVIGTAPVNLCDDIKSVTMPKLCYNFEEAKRAVGYSTDFDKYTVCQSIYASFKKKSAAPIVIINVLDPTNSKHITQVNGEKTDIVGGTAKINVQGIIKDSISVSTTNGELKAGTDYTTEFNSDGTISIVFFDDIGTSADISYKMLNPNGVTEEDIIGSVDAATGKESGMELIRQVFPLFGLVPGLLLAPGWSHKATVAAALQTKNLKINGVFTCESIIDIDCTAEGAKKTSDVDGVKNQMGVDSRHAIACWPMCKSDGHVVAMSAFIGALIAQIDGSNDDTPSLSPSNKRVEIDGICLSDGTQIVLDNEQANDVNACGVCTVLNFNGFKCWGNNTAAYPGTTDPKDRWIAVRRFFSWRGNSLILSYHEKVDDPGNLRLIENVVDNENIVGNSFVARDICASYSVNFDENENDITSLLSGKIKFRLAMSPFPPAEVINFILEFDTNALESYYSGGDS